MKHETSINDIIARRVAGETLADLRTVRRDAGPEAGDQLLDAERPTTKPLGWHDLRAAGLTWMAVRFFEGAPGQRLAQAHTIYVEPLSGTRDSK